VEGQVSMDSQNLLYDISRRLNSDLDLNRILADVLSLTVEHIGATNGSILILDEEGVVVHRILARTGMLPEEEEAVIAEVLSEGLAGWALKQQRAMVVRDVMADERWVHFPDDELVGGSATSVPLIRRDRLVGVITLRHREPDYFTDDHLDLLSCIAEQAAVAIENARLFHSAQTARAKLEAIINGAGDAILVADREGRVLLMNAVARRAFGISTGENLQRQHLTHVIENPSLEVLWEGREATEYPFTSEVPLTDGRTFHASIASVPNVGFVIVMQDITYLKELDKMKNEFVSAVSHDLRSPLQIVYTYTSLLSDGGMGGERQQEYIEGIKRSARKMSDLLDDLLDLARIQAGVGIEKERCDLGRVIVKVVERFEGMARKRGLTLQSRVQSDLPSVEAKVRHMDRVLSNLIDNAIKYTPAGVITLRAAADEEWVNVYVTDTGIGLKAEEQEKLFVKFYRAQNEQTASIEGTGLGLIIAKSIIEQYGGQMWVQSVWQEGSTFAFCLPRGKQG
jgi:two-component system phosphate regulon sensor histidine kinase PhoR